MIPVEVEGYLRLWDLVSPVELVEREGDVVNAVFLDIQPAPGRRTNGILIEVNEAELDDLDIREQNYNRVDVSVATLNRPDHATVFGYVGKPEFLADRFERTAVLGRYIEIVEAGLNTWGQAFADRYHETTEPHNFPIAEGPYRFLDPAQNRLTSHR